MLRHTRQNCPEIKRPTECNPTTGEEKKVRGGPLNFRCLKPFSYGRKGTPLLSRHVNRKFFYKKWTQKINTSIARYRLPKSITSIFIELFQAEVFCKCWEMLIYPFLSCNGRLESKKGFIISGRTRMLFL